MKYQIMCETEQRELGIKVLNQHLTKPQNAAILEKNIYELVTANSEHDYTTVLYQVIGDILVGKKLSDILKSVKSNLVGWEHSDYEQYKKELDEQDQFSENPIEIEEGVENCKKCKSTRVYSYSIQTRSADEGMTSYHTCMSCGVRWTSGG